MSQIIVPFTGSGPIPPQIPTQFNEQTGSATPNANILIIDAFDTNANNDLGLITKGGAAAGNPPGSGLSNEVSVYLTNRNRNSITTSVANGNDAIVTTLLSEALAVGDGTYYISGQIVAYNVTDQIGGAYSFTAGAYSVSGAAFIIGSGLKDIFEAAGMATSDIFFTVSGNNAVVQVLGVAGKTIDWKILANYLYVG